MVETYAPEAPLLEVEDLFVEFRTRDGVAKVLNGVTYYVNAGETLAVLGESGSGKSVTAQAIMGILDTPPAVVTGGEIRYHGENLLAVGDERRNEVRAEGIAIIFRHLLPNCLAPVLVYSTIALGAFISAEATLSFLGIGLRDPAVSWGVMISDARNYVRVAPHMLLFPAGFLTVTVLAFVMLGDAVREALDPKLR